MSDGQKHDLGSWKNAFLTAFYSRVTNSDTFVATEPLTRVSTPHRSASLAADEKTKKGHERVLKDGEPEQIALRVETNQD